jgi:hypothetical protein
VNAFSSSNGGRPPIDGSLLKKMLTDDSDDSSVSSIDSLDSPPTKRMKVAKGKVDKKAEAVKKAEELEEPDL